MRESRAETLGGWGRGRWLGQGAGGWAKGRWLGQVAGAGDRGRGLGQMAGAGEGGYHVNCLVPTLLSVGTSEHY